MLRKIDQLLSLCLLSSVVPLPAYGMMESSLILGEEEIGKNPSHLMLNTDALPIGEYGPNLEAANTPPYKTTWEAEQKKLKAGYTRAKKEYSRALEAHKKKPDLDTTEKLTIAHLKFYSLHEWAIRRHCPGCLSKGKKVFLGLRILKEFEETKEHSTTDIQKLEEKFWASNPINKIFAEIESEFLMESHVDKGSAKAVLPLTDQQKYERLQRYKREVTQNFLFSPIEYMSFMAHGRRLLFLIQRENEVMERIYSLYKPNYYDEVTSYASWQQYTNWLNLDSFGKGVKETIRQEIDEHCWFGIYKICFLKEALSPEDLKPQEVGLYVREKAQNDEGRKEPDSEEENVQDIYLCCKVWDKEEFEIASAKQTGPLGLNKKIVQRLITTLNSVQEPTAQDIEDQRSLIDYLAFSGYLPENFDVHQMSQIKNDKREQILSKLKPIQSEKKNLTKQEIDIEKFKTIKKALTPLINTTGTTTSTTTTTTTTTSAPPPKSINFKEIKEHEKRMQSVRLEIRDVAKEMAKRYENHLTQCKTSFTSNLAQFNELYAALKKALERNARNHIKFDEKYSNWLYGGDKTYILSCRELIASELPPLVSLNLDLSHSNLSNENFFEENGSEKMWWSSSSGKKEPFLVGFSSVNLSHNNLEDIPAIIDTRITFVPRSQGPIPLGSLVSSEDAVGQSSNLTTVVSTPAQNPIFSLNLTELDLSRNKFTSLNVLLDDTRKYPLYTYLTVLNASHNTLNQGHNSVKGFNVLPHYVSLTSLSLANVGLATLDSLTMLTNLQSLDISSNKLALLNGLGVLPLTYLNIASNRKINDILVLGVMTPLKNLDLSDNSQLFNRALPAGTTGKPFITLEKLTNLETLGLRKNGIELGLKGFSGTTHLTTLTTLDIREKGAIAESGQTLKQGLKKYFPNATTILQDSQ